MVRCGSAADPSHCTLLWCSWEAEVCCPGPDHREADALPSMFPTPFVGLLSTICGVPINTVLQLPLCHIWCCQGFPPTYQRGHKRNRPLTCDMLRDSRRTSLCMLVAAFAPPLHLLQEFHDFSLSFLMSNPRVPWSGSCHIRLLLLLCTFSIPSPSHTPLNLGSASSHFLSSSFFQGLSSTFWSHCQCFAHPSSLRHNSPTTSHPLLLSSGSVFHPSMVLAS